MNIRLRLYFFWGIIVSMFVFCALYSPRAAEAVKISVLQPSALELVMESGRDFYVIGRIDREGKSAAELPVDIRVEVAVTGLVRAGEKIPVRSVRSRVDRVTGLTPERDIFFDYEGKAPWTNILRGGLMKSPPPDLVYRNGDPASFYDPSVKAAVTEGTFAALVQGGITKDYDTDYEKVYNGDLEWKLFRVFVDALSGDEVLDSLELDIMFGTVQEKLLTSFFPPEHLAAAERFALPRGIRVYKNLFPGFWNFGLPSAYEIPLRWRRSYALEYLEGDVHAVIYNITASDAAQNTGLGYIAFEGWLDSGQVYFYRYDVGEPLLVYQKWGETVRREGVLTRFEEGDRLELTRAEIVDAKEAARDYLPRENAGRVELYPLTAVIVKPGEAFRVCGAVTPIQPSLSEVVPEDDAVFTVLNRIDKICYLFEDAIEGVLYTEEREAGLTRFYGETPTVSIYEFRHAFVPPESLRGRIVTVRVSARDKHGEFVDGTEEAFYLYIRE